MNQTIKKDAGKPRLTLVPMQILYDICEVREFGVQKYPAESWKEVEVQRYLDALLRHTLAFIKDPNGVDEESGLKHYKHAACNMAFLCELMKDTVQEDQPKVEPLDSALKVICEAWDAFVRMSHST